MSTSLKIFGETYNNVAGIKAKNVNVDTLTYILPSDFTPSLSGNAITIEDTVDPTGGTIRSIEAVDISDSTITADKILHGYVGYTANGMRVMGSAPESVSGQTIYTSSTGRLYTPTMIIDAGGGYLDTELKLYGTMTYLEDLTIIGNAVRITSGTLGQNSIFPSTTYPNLKRLTIALSEVNGNATNTVTFGHYAFSDTNLRELTLGRLGGPYFTGGGYFRGDCPVPPGKGVVSVGSLDGLRLTIYTDQYRDLGGFYGGNVTNNVASNTILTQYNYLTGEELTA